MQGDQGLANCNVNSINLVIKAAKPTLCGVVGCTKQIVMFSFLRRYLAPSKPQLPLPTTWSAFYLSSIMARTSQTAQDPSNRTQWFQREYVDHEGNTVILGKVATESRVYKPEEVEEYRLQVYSTTPIQIQPEELKRLYSYLCSDVTMPPFLEIYSYNPPDGLACVEHQRREVAHRKRLHAEQCENEYDESLPPLIPTMQTGLEDEFMSGFCFLLTSKSYLQRSFADDEHGTGPWWISFDRNLPSAVKTLDMFKRLDTPATDLQTFAEWGILVNPEIRDINVNTTTNERSMGFDIKELMRGRYSIYVYGEMDYGLHEPPPPAPSEETPTLQRIQEILEQQQQTAEVQSVDKRTSPYLGT
jgi:hypothetical protein